MIGIRSERRDVSIRRRLGFGRSRRLQRLSSPLVLAVFAAALFTALAVTFVSTRSIVDSLDRDPGVHLPMLVEAAAERLDLWYAQRASDVATFAGSAALTEHADALGTARSAAAEAAVGDYLDALRADYPCFSSFFVLDAAGGLLIASGPEVPPDATRRGLVPTAPAAARVLWLGERNQHIVSAPLARGGQGLTLHAIVPARALRSALSPLAMEAQGGLHVVDERGEPVVTVGPGASPLPEMPPPSSPDGSPEVARLTHDDGRLVVVASAGYERFHWRLLATKPVAWDLEAIPARSHRVIGLKGATAIFFTLLAVLLSGVILRPIRAFQEAVRSLADRDLGAAASADGDERISEVGVLTRAFQEVRGHLHRYQDELARKRREIAAANDRLRAQNEQLRRTNRILERMSVTDELTGLYNQRYFREHLPIEMKRAQRTGEPLSLILLDIDDFKQLNDRFGHAAGDAVLQHVARVFGEQTREMDLLARYGGEEFALLASQTPLEGALALAEKIRIAVNQTSISLAHESEPVRISVSGGAASFRGDESTLFDEADAALYRAKASGKDCVVAA